VSSGDDKGHLARVWAGGDCERVERCEDGALPTTEGLARPLEVGTGHLFVRRLSAPDGLGKGVAAGGAGRAGGVATEHQPVRPNGGRGRFAQPVQLFPQFVELESTISQLEAILAD